MDLWIRWGPLPGTAQEAFFDDDTPEADLLFAGGYGAGKTMTLTAKMMKLSAINNPIPIVWTVPQWAHVERTILPTLEDTDPHTGDYWFLSPNEYDYSPSRHVLSWVGGGEIQFASAEHEDSIKGPNVAAAGVDEPGIVSARAWRNTVARVRHPAARLRQRIAAGTPEGPNWLMDHFGADAESGARVYRMSTLENTELPPDFIEQLKANATEAELESYLHGRFSTLTGASAYPAFDADRHWLESVETNPQLPLRISFDFNVDPMACVVGQAAPGPAGQELRVIDAVVIPASTVMDVCAELVARYPSWPAGVWVYGDATGKARSTVSRRSNYDLIRELLGGIGPLKLKVPAANPPVEQRLNSVNRMLRDARGAERLVIRKTLPVSTCTTRPLVRSLQQSVKKPGRSDLWKKVGETVTHAGDALGYLVDYEWPATRPRTYVTMITPRVPATSVPISQAAQASRARRRARIAEVIDGTP